MRAHVNVEHAGIFGHAAHLRSGSAEARRSCCFRRVESPRLFRFLLRFLEDEEDARNVMQEAFLQAFQRIDTFRGDARLTTWLYGIALNQARVLRRKNRRYETMDKADLDRLQPSFSRGMCAQRHRPWPPDVLAEREDLRRLVREAIDRLPDSYREVPAGPPRCPNPRRNSSSTRWLFCARLSQQK